MFARILTRLGPVALSLSALAAAPSAVAEECSCMCIEGVSYEVCTGLFETRAITAECTAALECPVDDGSADAGDPVEAPPGAGDDLDCRQRNVYRPDLGEYKAHTVCMPAERTAAHERLRAKRAEMAERHEARRAESGGTTHRGNGPHSRGE